MSAQLFAPTILGGPWSRRLAERRDWVDELPWDETLPRDAKGARFAWTQTTFSEYAAAASFAEITAALAAAGAPIDLVAVASDFAIDEIVHVEVSARIAAALGGGVPMQVDLARLVRPPSATDPRMRAAELIVRVSSVGEALTVPLLALSRELCGSALIANALRRIMVDESAHARLGEWFLDWANNWLNDEQRAHLGQVAGAAIRAFAPIIGLGCKTSGLGTLACERYDPVFARAARERVARPLAEQGITVPADDLRAVGAVE